MVGAVDLAHVYKQHLGPPVFNQLGRPPSGNWRSLEPPRHRQGVVGVVSREQAPGDTGLATRDAERWISEGNVEPTGCGVSVLVVGDHFAGLALRTVHRSVESTEGGGHAFLLLVVDAQGVSLRAGWKPAVPEIGIRAGWKPAVPDRASWDCWFSTGLQDPAPARRRRKTGRCARTHRSRGRRGIRRVYPPCGFAASMSPKAALTTAPAPGAEYCEDLRLLLARNAWAGSHGFFSQLLAFGSRKCGVT